MAAAHLSAGARLLRTTVAISCPQTLARPQRAIARTAPSQRAVQLRPASPQSLAPRRLYSQPASSGEGSSSSSSSKIWNFDEIRELVARSPRGEVTLVDTREPGELAQSGRIPGAVNIPVASAPDSFALTDDEFEDRFGFARPRPDAELVFYCKAGVRSRAAAGLARAAGWSRVGEYPGSWVDWAARGGKVER